MNYINGTFVNGLGSKVSIHHKWTNQVIGEWREIDPDQKILVLQSSQQAFQQFKSYTKAQREAVLIDLKSRLALLENDFVQTIVAEAGKPILYAKAEFKRSLTTIDLGIQYLREEDLEWEIDVNYDAGIGKKGKVKRFPVGPVLAISPFNFPLNLVMHKLVPALVAGCSFVLKPSPYTPLTALKLAEVMDQLDLPKGTFNCVLASNDHVADLVKNDITKMLSFTGSAQVGWLLKAMANKKKVALELGGNAAVYVDEDADLTDCAQKVVTGAYLYAGQICISTQRILVHSSVYEPFKSQLLAAIKKLKTGDPMDENVQVGPLIDAVHVRRIQEWVSEAMSKGVSELIKGEVIGNALTPILLENVSKNCKVWVEEVFGPLAVLQKVDSFEQGLQLINDSQYGLQSGLFIKGADKINQAFDQLDVGGVIINQVPGFRVDGMPYGGVKESGFGREGVKYAVEEMTELKVLIQ